MRTYTHTGYCNVYIYIYRVYLTYNDVYSRVSRYTSVTFGTQSLRPGRGEAKIYSTYIVVRVKEIRFVDGLA